MFEPCLIQSRFKVILREYKHIIIQASLWGWWWRLKLDNKTTADTTAFTKFLHHTVINWSLAHMWAGSGLFRTLAAHWWMATQVIVVWVGGAWLMNNNRRLLIVPYVICHILFLRVYWIAICRDVFLRSPNKYAFHHIFFDWPNFLSF